MNGYDSHKPMPESGLSEKDERDLVALADGSLEGRRREEVEARVASSPELGAALGRQRAGLTALRALDQLAAPAGLRARVNAERSTPSPAVRGRRFSIGFAIAGAMAAVALATILILPSGSGGPTISEAAQLNQLPATEPPAEPDAADPRLLQASAQGLPYPNLDIEFGWRPAGQRQDEIEGRDATTVFYERGGKRIGYTILSGEGIEPPEDATRTELNDVKLASLSDGGQEIVTWWRDGHSCVLSGKGVSEKELLELASWKGDGAVPF
jgi:anti-sigma factor RsiW